MLWIASDPEEIKVFVDKIGTFLLSFAEAQIKAAAGRIQGMYIWGDVAYRNGMLFSPDTWRKVFKPHVKNLIDLCHQNSLMAIYHSCGDARPLYGDFVQMSLDGYNPLEAKADLDVVKLKKEYKSDLAFCGNIDVRILESGNVEQIEAEVLYKLQAAQGGGWIFQSDHSVSSHVSPESYDFAITTLRKNGNYPLHLK
jgi:uroporphyrinogen-III decarboxylase